CRSLNFCSKDKSCDLNDARRQVYPEDYGPKAGCIYIDVSESPESCAAIQQEWPQAESGYYWITIGSREVQVFCDMTSYDTTDIKKIQNSSKNLFRIPSSRMTKHNCTKIITWRYLVYTDSIAYNFSSPSLTLFFSGTFRVDVLRKGVSYTVFYQIPSGPEKFNSACGYGTFPRIIISYSYPYQWETNSCNNIDVGYRIYSDCHRAPNFDGKIMCFKIASDSHISFHLKTDHIRRALYGFPQCRGENNHGIYYNNSGMLFVK
ncbi:unnamed protein product, partial [Pocillopora meandrina]